MCVYADDWMYYNTAFSSIVSLWNQPLKIKHVHKYISATQFIHAPWRFITAMHYNFI